MSALHRSILAPRSIALVGVSRDASRLSGLALPYLLRAGFAGDVYVVHPSAAAGAHLDGAKVVSDARHLPEGIDLALAVVSAERTPDVVAGLAQRGTGAVVVGASGFSELGEAGSALEGDLAAALDGTSTRLIGPNCNGLYSVQSGVALGFNRSHGRTYTPGGTAIVSQSGALIGAVADLCTSHGAGLRGFFSTGNELDVGLVDIIEILADDAQTTVIALVLDRVGDPGRFTEACRRARANGKRILALKFGNSVAGKRASKSHSARMAGDSANYDVLFERSGVIRCASLTELAITAALMESRSSPLHPGALVISTSGAGGALAADALETAGVPLVELAADVKTELAPLLRFVKPGNPVDVGAGGSSNAGDNFSALQSTAEGICTVFFYLPPPTADFARLYSLGFVELVGAQRRRGTIGIAVMADRSDPDLVREWLDAGIPVVASVDEAAAIVANLQPGPSFAEVERDRAPEHLDSQVLSEISASALVAAAGVPFPESRVARDGESAADAAEAIGYPIVLKGAPAGIAHKSAAGLVVLDLRERSAVIAAADALARRMSALGRDGHPALLVAEQVPDGGADLIVSVKADPEFGAVGLLGIGGSIAEVTAAYRVLISPFDRPQVRNTLLALGLADSLALRGIPMDELVPIISRVLEGLASSLQAESLESIEINPLRVQPHPTRVVALDALAIVAKGTR